MQQAKPVPKVLFVHYLYSNQIQKAAADLTKHDGAECFFESSPASSLERCLTLQPDIVLTHFLSPSDSREFKASQKGQFLFCEYFMGCDLFLEKLANIPHLPLPKIIIITRIDENGYPLAFNFWKNDNVVSNYIMPPKDHWDVLLAVRQALYRRIEPIEQD